MGEGKERVALGVAGINEGLRVGEIGGKEEVEGGAVANLSDERSGGAGGHADFNGGVVDGESRDEGIEGEDQI